jgi:pimeloyl-ACP methyl ester carboxylesterase
MSESLQLRVHDEGLEPMVVYLPGLHGDWTLLGGFRQAAAGRLCLAEFTYPRREDWALDDYAREVEAMLIERGLNRGWLLGESFASQVVWAMVAREAGGHGESPPSAKGTMAPSFRPQGLILAGGFVRHPLPFCVSISYQASRRIPLWLLRGLCQLWAWSAEQRSNRSPEVTAGLREFVARRSSQLDRTTITRRYRIIVENDLRAVARCTKLPTFLLSGGFDPIVPWRCVRPWLRQHCPGFRESRIIRGAGHAVLLDAPVESLNQILHWIAGTSEEAPEGSARSAVEANSSGSCAG